MTQAHDSRLGPDRFRDGGTQPSDGAEGVESSAFSVGEGGCVVHRLWRLSLAGEARGVSQRLLSGVRGGAAGSAGADVRRGEHFLDSDPAGGVFGTGGMPGVRARSASERGDAGEALIGRGIFY